MIRSAERPEDTIIIVSGLPRSGTSMLMQMLAAGGIPPLQDGLRAADADNPRGYFEYEPVKKMRRDVSWINEAKGHAVKIVVPLAGLIPPGNPYRVVMIERNIGEIVASQTAMLARLGEPPSALSSDELSNAYRRMLNDTRLKLATMPSVSMLSLTHEHVIENPGWAARVLADFFADSLRLDVRAMTAVIDRKLYRQKRRKTDDPSR